MDLYNLSRDNNNTRIGTLTKKKITLLAKGCGFEKRKGSKVKAVTLILSFISMLSQDKNSYWDWSVHISQLIGKSISKQALFKRMNINWLETVKCILKETIKTPINRHVKTSLYKNYNNVYLQDSTTLSLPEALKTKYKGNFSNGKSKSLAKINVVINILTGYCPIINLTSYTNPEQKLGVDILDIAKSGDLVIRDLGYFVMDLFKKMQNKQIAFISRFRFGINVYSTKTGEKQNLLELLKKKKYIDIDVLCSEKKDLEVRLVAIKLSSKQTEERIRKAKKDRDKRLNHNHEYYSLLGYIIFITSVKREVWNYQEVAEAYKIRWNIEILFKSWKSGFKIEKIIPETRIHTIRVESMLYLILIYLTIFQTKIYPYIKYYKELKTKYVSVIKLAKYIVIRKINLLFMELDLKKLKHMIYYCTYDKRADRTNASKSLDDFLFKLS